MQWQVSLKETHRGDTQREDINVMTEAEIGMNATMIQGMANVAVATRNQEKGMEGMTI